jgi:flagellar protein FlaJ
MVNTLKLYPLGMRKAFMRNLRNSGSQEDPERYNKKSIFISFIVAIFVSTILFFSSTNPLYGLIAFVVSMIFFHAKISISAATRIKNMENVFPDVISLMASNLRSGITIDRAFLLAARPEFAPLDKEIQDAGREITTGKDIISALQKMAERIDSDKISKVISLIISGIKAGGNISELLEQTSANMKEKDIIEKKAASTVTMYVIFIFVAVGIGAPVLFGLSSVLVEVVITLSSRMPDLSSTSADLPFTFSKSVISVNFIVFFSIIFIIITDLISSMVIGLVQKGNLKFGLRFFLPLAGIGLTIFFAIRIFLAEVMVNMITSSI